MGTDSYVKSLRIKFEADDVSYKKIENDMNELSKLDLFSEDDAKAIANELKEFETLKNQISSIENMLDTIANVDNDITNKTRDNLEKELEKLKKQLKDKQREKPEDVNAEKQKRKDLQKEILSSIGDGFSSFGDALSETDNALGKTFGKFMSGTGELFENASKLFSGDFDSLNDILTSALESLGSLLASGFDELENILNFSQLSDANTRDLMMRYGFSNSEAYGYTKAMSTLGFKSEEDLMYANQQELELFRKSFEKYSGKYNELYNSGMFDSMQEFNTQMEEFKEDVKLEVVDFFMNNQDTIRAAMKGIISLAEFAITALGKIVQWLNPDARTSDSQKAANTASIISNYSNINSGTNVSIDNTFNNVAKSDQTWLAHAGQLTYEQIIKALQ
jgi:DNA repair exonuclease SbcCD ATPase subunit